MSHSASFLSVANEDESTLSGSQVHGHILAKGYAGCQATLGFSFKGSLT